MKFLFIYFINKTPLSFAIETRSNDIVSTLLSIKKIDVNMKVSIYKKVVSETMPDETTSEERSMLFIAYFLGKTKIIELLKSMPGIILDVTKEDVDEYIRDHQWQ